MPLRHRLFLTQVTAVLWGSTQQSRLLGLCGTLILRHDGGMTVAGDEYVGRGALSPTSFSLETTRVTVFGSKVST